MSETVGVRSGRRANFFITENRFIDCYAAKVGGSGVAVYSILQRCANSETRETWISANKMAEVLDMDKTTVYRYLEKLEKLQLIKRLKTREKTIYVVLPVPPPRPEAGAMPLFDAINPEATEPEPVWPPVAPAQMSFKNATESEQCNPSVAQAQRSVASVRPDSRVSEKRNKEEQDSLNKTQEQDLRGNKTLEVPPSEIIEASNRLIAILGLPDSLADTVSAAVTAERRRTQLSMDGVVARIATDARQARNNGIPSDQFIESLVAQVYARQIVDDLHLPATEKLFSVVSAAVKAESKYTGLRFEEAALAITRVASEDRDRGIQIDKFYFEDAKWRTNGKTSRAEKRTSDNLAANAEAKRRIRERLGVPRLD